MKNIQLDTSVLGILKSIIYVVVCAYGWLNEHGINAYAFTALLCFMIADMGLGVWKAKRVTELENPTSREAKKGILTKSVMFVIPAVIGVIWGLFDKTNALKIVNMLIIALAIAEGYSVIGNAGAVYTGKNITEFDAITYIFKVMSSFIKGLLEKFLQRFKDENNTPT